MGVKRDLAHTLGAWLAQGRREIGQVLIEECALGFELRHVAEAGRDDLAFFEGAESARALAKLDDGGVFRPLKTAPNLRRGWRLALRDLGELRRALDYFYPAMLGVGRSFERGELAVVPLRETLGRQTGMYRVTQKITDAQARVMIDGFCAGCLKRRLWDEGDAGICTGGAPAERLPAGGAPALRSLPLLCQEACNLLVAEARKVVKCQTAA